MSREGHAPIYIKHKEHIEPGMRPARVVYRDTVSYTVSDFDNWEVWNASGYFLARVSYHHSFFNLFPPYRCSLCGRSSCEYIAAVRAYEEQRHAAGRARAL